MSEAQKAALNLNPVQVAFLSKATSDCADLTASRVFGDVDPDTFAMLGADDKKALMMVYETWNQNGNIEKSDLAGIESGYFTGQAWVWASYVAHLLPQLTADRDALQLQLDIERAGAQRMGEKIAQLRAQLREVCEAGRCLRIAQDMHLNSEHDDLTWPELSMSMDAFDRTRARVEPEAAQEVK